MRVTTEPKSHTQKGHNRASNQAYVRLAHTSYRPVEVRYDSAHLQSQVLKKLRQEDSKNKNKKETLDGSVTEYLLKALGLPQDHIHILNIFEGSIRWLHGQRYL